MNTTQRWIRAITFLVLAAFTIYNLVYGKASLFFMVYLFWLDELLATISDHIQIGLANRAARPEGRAERIPFHRSRYFMLGVYFVFLVPVFGIFFNLGTGNKEDLITNMQILLFRDHAFNICIGVSIIREILIILDAQRRNAHVVPVLMSTNMMVLHVSIVLGGFLWALTHGKFSLHLDLGIFNRIAIGLPFLILRTLADIVPVFKSPKTISALSTGHANGPD